jgi:hypothetical protein
MELAIRSILTCLVVTIAFALPVNQANANPIWKDHETHSSGSVSYKDFDKDFKKKFESGDHRHEFIQKLLEHKKVALKDKDKDEFGEHHRSWGGCYGGGYRSCGDKCDHRECDDGDHNVPEPNPLALMGLGLVVIGLVRRFVPSRHS